MPRKQKLWFYADEEKRGVFLAWQSDDSKDKQTLLENGLAFQNLSLITKPVHQEKEATTICKKMPNGLRYLRMGGRGLCLGAGFILNTVFAVNKYNIPQLQLYRTLDSRKNKMEIPVKSHTQSGLIRTVKE